MVKQIILLSGNVSSGKSTLSYLLKERFDIKIFKTRIPEAFEAEDWS